MPIHSNLLESQKLVVSKSTNTLCGGNVEKRMSKFMTTTFAGTVSVEVVAKELWPELLSILVVRIAV